MALTSRPPASGGHAEEADLSRQATPHWQDQVIGVLSAGLDPAAAHSSARGLDEALGEFDDAVPMRVVHDWHGRTVVPVLCEAFARLGVSSVKQAAVGRAHLQALTGDGIGEAEWSHVLEAALTELYFRAYPYTAAYDVNYANARIFAIDARRTEQYADEFTRTFAVDTGRTDEDVDRYARSSADQRTRANANAFALTNATVNARLLAAAYAAADERRYAETMPFAHVNACVRACVAPDDGSPASGAAREACCRRLADGLLESLTRVSAGLA